ncbi:hypothetical protein Achl_4021 (plasmid) [Pseudarthrobacter chlorophenolicus A6]|uniref:Uncharacterized protein n=1 Tax=Pseudarthrobacter chlorophenolicus (strain ATCC 700700 / DSM 12829 / CIP 107037 / JCM 12360 / KCTC 9906 / NCIMB 13794 / A6) TaxID=452863 RepID=B8HHS5_PSECP|nr:hypothetical protein [Pseudarthrobacter chlorophenolicus]ACL41972.1 hypothetical protein Achl_4021 [Pseudarthrobacter chlorophenolicus A6]SDQ19678.1 hypothetical protein SAMN04489738_0672 [Pseudarthrobacter chlorophenolicus]
MTTESDVTVASAPEITAGAIYDIVSKISPFAFDGMNVAMSANFESFLEKITFGIEYTNEDQTATDASPFLAMVRSNQDLLAARLIEARDAARISGVPTPVPMDGIETDPTWPQLILSAGPYNPAEDEDAS